MDHSAEYRLDPDSGVVTFGDGDAGDTPPADSVVGSPYQQGGGSAGNVAGGSPSALRRLLDEISWEGNARKYRGGGGHLENVVTAEVFAALDFLPREHFLANVLRQSHGAEAARERVVALAEDAAVDVLPGNLSPTWLSGELTGWRIQPDVLITSPESVVYVEAKAPHGGTFSPAQIARSLHAALHEARDRTAVLLLVLDAPPPVRVRRLGALSLQEALEAGLAEFPVVDSGRLRAALEASVAWTTWDDIAESVRQSLSFFSCTDPSLRGTVNRLAGTLINAIGL